MDGQEVFSKSRTKRHAYPGEVVQIIKQLRQEQEKKGMRPAYFQEGERAAS